MPYIITTGERGCGSPCTDEPGRDACELVNVARHAVATLDEARETAYPVVHAAWPDATNGNSDEARAHRWAIVAVQNLSEAGGTIGPLPNGTVIEVRQVDWNAFPPMNDLRAGRITPDDFRSTVRAMKAQHGDAAVMKAKLSAIASSNR
jgi:hypothetical protein